MVFSSSPSVPTPTTTGCADDEVAAPLLLPSSGFKTAVPQPNGHRSAHIDELSAREPWWLAAFAREETAALAYDVAERRHRGSQAVTSRFTVECFTNGDLAFQATRSTAMSEAVDDTPAGNVARQSLMWHAAGQALPSPWVCQHLFQKVLTPSDVGNLNRLVVPKHHAEEHFLVKRSPLMAAGMGVHLDFRDGEGKAWRFRYSYCTSSRIYIFTKGWRGFVREKGLQAGDTVAFSRSWFGPFKQLIIDYRKTKKKQDDVAAGVIAADSRVVRLFGVDIAR